MELVTRMSDKIETLVGVPARSFDEIIREKYKHRCGNCGGEHKLKVSLIIPEEAGGQQVESNGVLLCRACEMAADAVPAPGSGEARRPINIWVSRRLYDRMQNGMRISNGFKSMGALVRYLMTMYVTDAKRFDDLERYQDSVAGDVKVNFWVSAEQYDLFKRLVNQQGLSVTDALKALVQLFDEETITRESRGQ